MSGVPEYETDIYRVQLLQDLGDGMHFCRLLSFTADDPASYDAWPSASLRPPRGAEPDAPYRRGARVHVLAEGHPDDLPVWNPGVISGVSAEGWVVQTRRGERDCRVDNMRRADGAEL